MILAMIGGSVASAAQLELFPGDDLVSRTASLQPGDELILNDGLYQISGQLSWTVLGTAEAPVVMRAADGARPVIELIPSKDGYYSDYILRISDSSWIRVEGITFQGNDGWRENTDDPHYGVRIGNSTNITLSGVEIARTGRTALYLSELNSDITVESSHIHDTLDGHGVYVGCYDASCWTASSTFANNWIHNIGGTDDYGMFLCHGSQGVDVRDSVLYNIEYRGAYIGSTEYGEANTFEGNAVWNTSSIGLYLQGAARVRNNIIFNIDGTGIYSSDPDRETFGDQVISFNTVANTAGWALYTEDWFDAPGMVMANNALCNPTGYSISYDLPGDFEDTAVPDTENVLTGNVACGLVEGLLELERDTAVLPGAGLTDFSDVEGWDFYPSSADSLLVNTADPDGRTFVPEVDFNGLPRDGGSPDVGAYEYIGAGNPGWPLQEGFKEFAEPDQQTEEQVGGGCCSENRQEAALLVPLVALGALRRRRRR